MAVKIVATNRKARHDYTILDTYETGIELRGSEVKSLRQGKASLADSFARIDKGEVFVYNLHITPYEYTKTQPPDPIRVRKLLLHKNEINRLSSQVSQKGLTLVPLKLYFKRGRAKIELALAKGKRFYDKRETIRRREAEREMRRSLRRK